MDRETLIYIAATTIALTLIGGLYLAPARTAGGGTLAERSTFAQEDVRYKLQQEEVKAAKKTKRKRSAPPPDSAPEEQSENEEPPIDESAEEPPIE